MSTNGDQREFSDSDQAWFDRLRPGPKAAAADAAQRSADALSHALELTQLEMLRLADPDPATAEAERQRRWQQLQFRLRRDEAQVQRRRWVQRGGWGALAASVLMAVVLVQNGGPWGRDYDEPPTERGGMELVQRSDASPRGAAEALAQQLRDAGLQAALHQRGRVYSVDVMVSEDSPAAALVTLRAAGAKALPGVTRIAFAPP